MTALALVLLGWIITAIVAWLVIDELWCWRRMSEDNLQGTLDAWKRTIDDLEAANRRIAALETQLATERSGDEWKQ
jgi:hypothetical protein